MSLMRLTTIFVPIAAATASLSGCQAPVDKYAQCRPLNAEMRNTDKDQRFGIYDTETLKQIYVMGEVDESSRTSTYIYGPALKPDETNEDMGWVPSGLGFNVYLNDIGQVLGCSTNGNGPDSETNYAPGP